MKKLVDKRTLLKLPQHLVRCSAVDGSTIFSLAYANEWLYVFGFATHILSFKAIQPIGKTDIYNVLTAGLYY